MPLRYFDDLMRKAKNVCDKNLMCGKNRLLYFFSETSLVVSIIIEETYGINFEKISYLHRQIIGMPEATKVVN